MAGSKSRELKFFAAGLLTGLIGVLGSLVAVGVGLAQFAPDRMPAPALSSLVHLDEKLRFIREHRDYKPTILAVGSSVTWRQLAGKPFDALPGRSARFLNAGTAHLRVHQTRAMAGFLLDHYPGVETLIVMVSMPDFENCRSEPETLFDPRDAARYAFDDWPAFYFYFHYVSPMRYVRTAMSLVERRTPLTGDLYLDEYGSGPVQVPKSKDLGLRYGEIEADPACVDALDGLIADLEARNVQLLLVFTPIHPDYRARYPETTARLSKIAEYIETKAGARARSAIVLNLIRDDSFAADNFYDAFHLQWNAAQVLSGHIAESLDAETFVRGSGSASREVELPARPPQRQSAGS